ncbi:MAG TPA: glycosyltransferase family 39 protein [Polyangiaceae bacterium]|nr:glycosyltransferase family 39 protein [Polyangiaceae bacterium]
MPGDEPSINETSAGVPRGVLDRWDALIALGLGLSYLALLLGTVENLGYMRDEGFYFQAAQVLESWLDFLSEHGKQAFEQGFVDRYFAVNHEHPLLMKLLFALSHRYLHERFGLFAEAGTAYRFPGMLMAVLAVVVVYLWGREIRGRVAGVVSALLLALMPRVFFHAHLACFDVPVAAMWLTTAYAYFRSLGRGPGWAIATGVLYGLLLDTKHNSWLLPFALVAHLVSLRVLERLRGLPRRGPLVPWALPALLVVGPLVFYALWPWIWFDTLDRLAEYARFHLGHEYYNMEFLGATYWKPPMPRLYAWVMTLATVPAITLVLFGIGTFDSVRHALGRRAAPNVDRLGADMFWVIGLLVSYAPWISSDTPIFGGTKHWITAYPFLCLLAGHGVALVAERIGSSVASLKNSWLERPYVVPIAVASTCLVGPLTMTLHSQPWGLSFYTPLVGGAPGAASLGLNRTFWGYTTGALTDELDARAERPVAVYVHDTALQSFEMFQRDGRLSPNLRPTLAIQASRLALYHHEPHMRRVEYEVWVDYGTRAPAAMGAYDGVPVAWLYERPRAPR